ncbi:TIGR02452 family protein [Collinsella tanakaei]|uniref:TIGR02452 family protein n=1 Tax=Collinsella tanakaei TaxID=626935 RepID=UPI0025A4955C|nr:TIGR02452 family protein [Collinsella tanakaei]MDM8299915.1 TIGR02452 family protein [Collinsella tanakaei]
MAERSRNPRKMARASAAKEHTEQMAARYGREIERSSAGTVRYDGRLAAIEEGCVPQVSVVATDVVSAILENGRGRAEYCDLAVLDFASFVNPGGGYIRGTMAQEEALCTESFLYNVLEGFGDWYAENRRRNLNCELYRNRALAVPAVRFGRNRIHAYADVIVAAAPNARRARADYKVSDEVLEETMRERIAFALSVIDARGLKKAVLGAYGCGVFGWDASVVAEMFRAELASGTHGLEEVVFAIPRTRYDDNLARFEHAFAAFPKKNDESFADAQARAAAAAAQATQDDDDEDEDDWRKYL